MKHRSRIFNHASCVFFRKGFFIIAVLPTAYYLLLVSHSALAQGIDLPTVSNLSTKPLADTAVSIINAFLGLVGIIALGIFVYGGYLWMFSAGDPKKLLLAKKVLISAVIGLIIILSSWAIVNFIINGATGGGGGGGPVVVAPPPLPGASNFVVKWIDPKNDASDVPLCRIVQAGFSANLDSGTVNNSNIIIQEFCNITDNCAAHGLISCVGGIFCQTSITDLDLDTNGSPDGIFNVSNSTFEYLPPREWSDNSRYLISITSGVQSMGATPAVPFSSSFSTGTTSDNTPPQVSLISPADGSTDVCLIRPITVKFSEPMRVSSLQDALTLDSTDQDYASFEIAPISPANLTFGSSIPSSITAVYYPTVLYAANQPYNPVLRADIIQDACLNFLDGNKNGTEEKSPLDDYGDSPADTDGDNAAVANYSFTTGTTEQCVPEITAASRASLLRFLKQYHHP